MTEVAASSAQAFTASIGINTHVDAEETSYGNVVAVENALAYLGVSNVRDTIDNPDDEAEFTQFNQQLGVKFDFFISPGSAGFTLQLNDIEAVPGIVAYVEGANESDDETQYYNGLSGLPATQAEMQVLYASVHGDPQLAGVPVIQTSFGNPANSAVYGAQPGTANFANVHLYFGTGNNPAGGNEIGALVDDAQIVTPGAPTIATEAGYPTLPGDPNSVSQTVQADYLLDLIFDDWAAGISTTYLFELVDRQSVQANNSDTYHFGLFNSDWTPKPAAIALHNLTTILSDPGTGGVPTGSLGYSLTGMPSTANSTLLEMSDGTFVLALWNDVRLSGPTTQTDINVAPVPVTLTLDQPYESVALYDPLTGTTAVQSFTNAQTVQIMVPDHPVLIEIGNTPAPTVPTGPIIDAPAKLLAAAGGIARVPGLSVTDSAAGFVTVVVSDTGGTLFMQDSDGQEVLGSGTSSITLSGSAAIVDAELATLAYVAPVNGGSDTIKVQTKDATGRVATDVIPVQTIGLPASVSPEGPLLSLPSTMTVAVGSRVAIPDAVLTDSYYATNPGLLTLTVSASTGMVRMTVNGQALPARSSITVSGSFAAVSADLQSMVYVAGANSGAATLTVGVTDAAGLTASASLPIAVTSGLAFSGTGTLTMVTGTQTSLGAVQVGDSQIAGNSGKLTLTLSDATGLLTMLGPGGVPLTGSGTSRITVSGTPDQINSELATLTYLAGATSSTDAVAFTVTTTSGVSASASETIDVTSAIAIAAPTAVSVGTYQVTPVTGVTVADIGAGSGSLQMTVRVSDLSGVLSMVDAAGNAVPGSGGHSIALTGSLAAVNAELATLTYTGPSYAANDAITVAASDNFGAASTHTISVPVTVEPALTTYFKVGDAAQDPFSAQPILASGSMILTPAATGLQAGISEQVSNGVVSIASLGWNLDNALLLVDPAGGSYVLSNSVWVGVTLSGAPTSAGQAETLTVNDALWGSVTLGTGNQNVVINAGAGGAVPNTSNLFTVTEGSGTDSLTVNGYDELTQIDAAAGSGTDTMSFINVGAVSMHGGSGYATVFGGNTSNAFTAGTGTVDLWGGSGPNSFTYHNGDGIMIIENYGANDYIFADQSLEGSVSETTTDSAVLVQFGGSPQHQIQLNGLSYLPLSDITWS